jgi:hypothetical protein
LDAETKGNKRKRKNEQDKESTVVSYYYFIKQFLIAGGNHESHTKQSYLNKSCTTIYQIKTQPGAFWVKCQFGAAASAKMARQWSELEWSCRDYV